MYLQFTTSVVNILDGISDWPEDVIQEQSSAYVYDSHSKLYKTACEVGVIENCISVYRLCNTNMVTVKRV